MKNLLKISFTLFLALVIFLSFAGCNKDVKTTNLWESATYTEDTSFGSGTKTVNVTVKVEENAVTFTIKTNKDTVGDALLEHGLIEGEEGPFGIYIKKVNGMLADYDVDRSYWAFYIDGDYAMSGVESTEIDEKVKYELVYEK